MKILLLADPSSTHIIKWVNAISNRGIEILLFGLQDYAQSQYINCENVKIISMRIKSTLINKTHGSLKKLLYLKAVPKLRKLIKAEKPDILHSHYASSYGLLGALSGFNPYILSVWGADIYNFPKKNKLFEYVFKFSLNKADKILSTSHTMAGEISFFTKKQIIVTPFGIDIEKFKNFFSKTPFNSKDIIIGTVKSLEKKYGIDVLIKAFTFLKNKYQDLQLKLLIVGKGSEEKNLKKLANDLGIRKDVLFTGFINQSEVPQYQNMLHIFVSVSIYESESFGVAVLEASACEKPVVVSNVGGLPEVVEDGKTGFIVEKQNPIKTAEAIEKLLLNKSLREQMGKNGRKRVIEKYNFSDNVDQMVEIYNKFLR
jgi:glycosyltransferase involved in cell wall biosynthesis